MLYLFLLLVSQIVIPSFMIFYSFRSKVHSIFCGHSTATGNHLSSSPGVETPGYQYVAPLGLVLTMNLSFKFAFPCSPLWEGLGEAFSFWSIELIAFYNILPSTGNMGFAFYSRGVARSTLCPGLKSFALSGRLSA
jgi:hypothetical protein